VRGCRSDVIVSLQLIESHEIKLSEATVVFCNNYVFPTDLEDAV
jgi:hypothetical protein